MALGAAATLPEASVTVALEEGHCIRGHRVHGSPRAPSTLIDVNVIAGNILPALGNLGQPHVWLSDQ